MKKIIAVILVLLMSLSLFTGCSSKGSSKTTPSSGSNTTQSPTDKQESSNKQEPAAQTPGMEISNFLGKYSDTKTKLWDELTKKLDSSDNLNVAIGLANFAFADLTVVEVLLFDALTVKDGDTFKGKLMMSDIDAWKKVKGDIVEFGYDYTYQNDQNNYLKGDHLIAKGTLDKSKDSLTYEYTNERGGKIISRFVSEIVRNADTSYSSQTYYLDLGGNNDKNTLTAYLSWFDSKNVISYMAAKDTSDINFSYNSIFGKKNIKPDEMANGMTITTKVSYVDGKASYEDLSNK